MFASQLFTAAAILCGIAHSAPLTKRQNIDTTVLQFALTLEHLENAFYKQALQKFSVHDFEQAGYSADYYNDLMYIAHDEEQHVLLLEGALTTAGITPVQACTYSFPYSDVRSFVTLSSVLEGVGTSAYLGGAPLITSKAYLTVAGSILVTEALHTSLQRLAINEVPMANPYGTPLDPTSVYTLAAMFITSCPADNPPLPFTPFPALQVDESTCTCEEPNCGSPSQVVKRSWAAKHHGWPGHWSPNTANTCMPPAPGSTVMFTAAKNITAGSHVKTDPASDFLCKNCFADSFINIISQTSSTINTMPPLTNTHLGLYVPKSEDFSSFAIDLVSVTADVVRAFMPGTKTPIVKLYVVTERDRRAALTDPTIHY